MSLQLLPFPSFQHPPYGSSPTELPVTRDGVRLVPGHLLTATTEPGFAELRISVKDSDHTARGLCGLLPASAFLDGSVRPHEETLLVRLERQERCVLEDGGALGKPVLLTVPSLAAFWAKADAQHQTTAEQVGFRGKNNDYQLRPYRAAAGAPAAVTDGLSLADLGPLVIADGHHRAETHARLSARGVTACDYIPVCLIGADELTIGAFTRVIEDARRPSALLPALDAYFHHERLPGPVAPTHAGEWLMVCADTCYRLTRRAGTGGGIDNLWLNQNVLPAAFNINDTSTDKRVAFDATPDPVDGELHFERETGKVYLCGVPLPVPDFFAEVEAGRCLPPKSTRFEPRVPSGLVVWEGLVH